MYHALLKDFLIGPLFMRNCKSNAGPAHSTLCVQCCWPNFGIRLPVYLSIYNSLMSDEHTCMSLGIQNGDASFEPPFALPAVQVPTGRWSDRVVQSVSGHSVPQYLSIGYHPPFVHFHYWSGHGRVLREFTHFQLSTLIRTIRGIAVKRSEVKTGQNGFD